MVSRQMLSQQKRMVVVVRLGLVCASAVRQGFT